MHVPTILQNGTKIICHVSKKYRKYRTFIGIYKTIKKIQKIQDALYALHYAPLICLLYMALQKFLID